MDKAKVCDSCSGRGYRPEKRPRSKSNPDGSGFYSRSCRKCGGSGMLALARHEPGHKCPCGALATLRSGDDIGLCVDCYAALTPEGRITTLENIVARLASKGGAGLP